MISGLSHSSHAKTLIMTVQVAVGKAVHHAIATGDPAVLEKNAIRSAWVVFQENTSKTYI